MAGPRGDRSRAGALGAPPQRRSCGRSRHRRRPRARALPHRRRPPLGAGHRPGQAGDTQAARTSVSDLGTVGLALAAAGGAWFAWPVPLPLAVGVVGLALVGRWSLLLILGAALLTGT